LFPVGSVNYLITFLAQSFHHQFADKWIILDEKYSHRPLLNTLTSDASLERPNLETVPAGRWPSLSKLVGSEMPLVHLCFRNFEDYERQVERRSILVVQISGQPMKCWRQHLSNQFT
jgi:hypothetical protein